MKVFDLCVVNFDKEDVFSNDILSFIGVGFFYKRFVVRYVLFVCLGCS